METQLKRKSTFILSFQQQKLLEELDQYQYLTASMVQKLFKINSIRTAQYRLRCLWKAGLTRQIRLYCPLGEGSKPITYMLTSFGKKYLKNEKYNNNLANNRIKDSALVRGAIQLHHLLEVNRILISVKTTCENEQVSMDISIPYYQRSKIEQYKLNFIPDAVFSLSRQGKQSLFFLEVDRGTEPIQSTNRERSSISLKFDNYYQLLKIGKFKCFGKFSGFRVLFVIPTPQRRKSLLNFAFCQKHAKCLWFTVEKELNESNILFEKLWYVPGKSQPHALLKQLHQVQED